MKKNTDKIKSENSGNILKIHKIKSTKAKLAILGYLKHKNIPVSIEEISKNLKSIADYSTVFRTLVLFEKTNIAKKVTLKGKSSYYEINIDKHHHHHLICESCGKIEDLDICVKDIEDNTMKKSKLFSNISSHSIELYGICKKCIA